MEFRRNVRIGAPLSEVWALVDEIPAVAGCIPGVHDLEMRGDREFDCVLTQRVGSVKASFKLHAVVDGLEPRQRLTLAVDGRDAQLNSNVKATQEFTFSEASDQETEVGIVADFQVTGRIATFGHRIILAKAEQVTVEALRNVDKLLEERRAEAS